MEGTELLQSPLNMPEGSALTFAIESNNVSTDAPVVAARATGVSGTTNTNTHPITLPSNIEVGELLLVVFSSDGAPLLSVQSGTGWSFVGQRSNGTTVTGGIFWKIADGNDGLTVQTSAVEQSSHMSFRISGIKNPGNVGGSSSDGSSTNSNPPSHTMPGIDNRGRLWIVTRSGDAQVVATVAPSGYDNLQTQAASGADGASTNTAEKTTTGTTNTESPGTFTSATEQWVCFTIGIDVTGSHKLNFSEDFVQPVPAVNGSTVLQVLKLPDDKYISAAI
jgi:hypothetical protein